MHHRLADDGRLLPRDARRPRRVRQGRLGHRARRPHRRRTSTATRGGRAMVEADLRRTYPDLADVAGHARLERADRPHAEQPAAARAASAAGRTSSTASAGAATAWGRASSAARSSRASSLGPRRRLEPLSAASAAPLGRFPPEPIRYVGAHVVRAAVARKERAEIRDEKPSWLDVRLARLAPGGLEDKG